MRSPTTPWLVLVLLFVICFSLATALEPRSKAWTQKRQQQDVLGVLLGDSRRMFANHFFTKADAYFHSGFYPTIFDNQESFKTAHMAADAGAVKSHNQGEETEFMGQPRDFIENFSRHFLPSVHTHLDEGGTQSLKPGSDLGESETGDVREILPWLKISADLNPNSIETYTVTAFWLRKRMGKVDEAEQFLREGLRANPGNPSLLFELGRIYYEDRKDVIHSRNIWEIAVSKLDNLTNRTEQDDFMLMQLSLNLARLEESQSNYPAQLRWLERLKPLSPEPDVVAKEIEETRKKIQSPQNAPPK